ncbi:uncharacterized protein V2V93DRAFT_366499 [Kockiozyma suomiensis]|uniref:uncharacterized protein n=1 Tax=Kockiozyma suomiensis TaxID=1337062 RepID=UPI003343EF87
MPSPIGYDVAGIVERVGAGVTSLKPGTAVFSRVPENRRGTFQEYIVCSASDLSLKPTKMSFEDAAALPLVSLTALQCFEHAVLNKPEGVDWFKGKTVLILSGLGSVGAAACLLAKNVFGVGKVITTVSTSKVPLVPQMLGEGIVDEIIDYKTQNPTKVLQTKSVDFLLDTVGSAFSFLHIMKPGGVISTVAFIPSTDSMTKVFPHLSFFLYSAIYAVEKLSKLRARRYGVELISELLETNSEKLNLIAQYYLDGKIKAFIAAVVPLSDEERVKEAFTKVNAATGYTGKMVVRISDPSLLTN